MQHVVESLAPLRQAGARLGPYVLLELLLPGGTLFALLLFLHQHVKAHSPDRAVRPPSPSVTVSASYAAAADARSLDVDLAPAGEGPVLPGCLLEHDHRVLGVVPGL